MAEPVLLISSDPFLGASLEAVARGRVQVARLDLARRPVAWPAEPAATVVLDVAAGQRDAVHGRAPAAAGSWPGCWSASWCCSPWWPCGWPSGCSRHALDLRG